MSPCSFYFIIFLCMAVFMLGFDLSYISAESAFSQEEKVLIIRQINGPANPGYELTLEQLTRMVMETRMEEEKLQALMDEILQRLEALRGTDYPASTLVELFSIYQQSLWSLSSYTSDEALPSSLIEESSESSEIQPVPIRTKVEKVDFAHSFQQRNIRQMTSPSEQLPQSQEQPLAVQKPEEDELPSPASSVAYPRRKIKPFTVDNLSEAGTSRFVPSSPSSVSPSSPTSSARSSTSFAPSVATMSNVPVLSAPIQSLPISSFSTGQNQIPQTGNGECRLIFSINAGRSGSGYLAEVLGLSPLINAGHERDPVMFGTELKMVKQMGLPATYQYRKMQKVPYIDLSIHNHAGQIYAESSHLFIKDFYDVVMDEYLLQRGCRVDVIVLRRYLLDTLASLARLEWQANSPNWYYTLKDTHIAKTRAPSFLDMDQHSSTSPEMMEAQKQADMRLEHLMGVKKSDLEEILGYLIDLEQQTLDFQSRYPQANMIDVRLETLQTPEGVESLFRELDLPQPSNEAIQAIAGVPVNQKGSQHPGLASEQEKELALREFVQNYRHQCAQEGISLPPLPSMKKLSE